MPLREAFKAATDTDLAKRLHAGYLGVMPGARAIDGEESKTVDRNEAVTRRREIKQRLMWWRDQGAPLVESLVDLIFENKEVRKQRKRFARMACAHNSTKRLTDEVSNLYEEPPRRTFRGREVVEKAYADEADRVQLDELMQEAQPIAFLCSAVLFWSTQSPATNEHSLRIVTLDQCDPVPHPDDPLHMAGVILDCGPTTSLSGADRDRLPHFEVWDEKYRLELNANFMPIGERVEHHLGRLPGFLAHAWKPVEKLVEWERGGDIIAAHEAVAFLNLLSLRLAKSQGENQPIMSGDLARMATKQPADGERPIALPPGVTVEMLQTKTDPEHYLKLLKHFIGGVAQTYGMSYEQFTFQETTDSTSGRAYKVRRQKLSEIRSKQRRRWGRHERGIAILLGFDPTGFHVDYHDPALPQEPREELEVEEKKWRLGQSNPVEYMRRQDPDLRSDDEALTKLLSNIHLTSVLWSLLRKQNAPSDSDAVDSGKGPQANGAQGQSDTPPSGETTEPGEREPQSRMATGANTAGVREAEG